jgi:hypothetical protein
MLVLVVVVVASSVCVNAKLSVSIACKLEGAVHRGRE